jgi:adenosine deaminase
MEYIPFTILLSRSWTSGAILRDLKGTRDINKCFGIFSSIHRLIRTREEMSRIMDEVLEDFMDDNVIYLELRTTPRELQGKSAPYCFVFVLYVNLHQSIAQTSKIYSQYLYLQRWHDEGGIH